MTDVLGKVRSGEADAGLVYVTDVKGAWSAVVGVPFAQSSAAVNVYPIAALKTSTDAALAQAFVDAVTGAAGSGHRSRPRASARHRETHPVGTPGAACLRGSSFPPQWVGCSSCSPWSSMLTRVDWSHFLSLVTSDSSLAALTLSLRTSLASTVACVLLGVPMALVLARTSFRGQSLFRSLVLLPLVLPPVVGGIALLYTFGRRGLLGHTLQVSGLQIAFSTAAVVMAQTFVALPFLVDQPRWRTAHRRPALRGGGCHARRPSDHGVPAGDPAAGRARVGVGGRAGLRPRPG